MRQIVYKDDFRPRPNSTKPNWADSCFTLRITEIPLGHFDERLAFTTHFVRIWALVSRKEAENRDVQECNSGKQK